MTPQKRRVPPPCARRGEDVESKELEYRDPGCHRAPHHEPSEEDRQVLCPAHDERHRHHEQRVLAELEIAHEMLVEQRVVGRGRPQRRERHPGKERRTDDPEPHARLQPIEPTLHYCDGRGDEYCDERDVRETNARSRRAELDTELGLEALVEKQEGH